MREVRDGRGRLCRRVPLRLAAAIRDLREARPFELPLRCELANDELFLRALITATLIPVNSNQVRPGLRLSGLEKGRP